MTKSGNIVPLENVEPEMARRLLPGVRFFVSAKTFAEAAAECDKALQTQPIALPARDAQATD